MIHMKSLFLFSGSASRKEWWCTTLLTSAVVALLAFLCYPSPLGSLLCALVLIPWLAVSARRVRSTGNTPEHCIFSFGGLATLLLLLPHVSETTLAIAAPFVQLLCLIGGIIALSYAVICGFVTPEPKH